MLKIMIAVDGSEPSLDAVHHAISLVRQGLQAHFVLAHVQQEASLFELATQDSDMIAAAPAKASTQKGKRRKRQHLVNGQSHLQATPRTVRSSSSSYIAG